MSKRKDPEAQGYRTYEFVEINQNSLRPEITRTEAFSFSKCEKR